MAYSVTHFLVPIVILAVLRFYSPTIKARLTSKHLLLVGFFGLIPDLDLPILWIGDLLRGDALATMHRTYFHNIFFPLAILAFFLILLAIKRQRLALLALLALFAVVVHLALDAAFGAVMFLYPLNLTWYGFQLLPRGILGSLIQESIDTALFVIWIIYMFSATKLKTVI